MKKFFVLLYGVISYLIFLGALLYLIAFLNNLLVPKAVDTGEPASLAVGTLINMGLVALFAVQHTVMARPWFKQWWKRTLPEPIERSTYVLFASLTFGLLFWQWRPMPEVLWSVNSAVGVYAIYGLQLAGWGLVLLSSFLINHFELFGLQQVYFHWREKHIHQPQFRLPWLYKLVRHPLMLGFLIAFWSVPQMTQGHLVFTLGFTIYIFVGIHFEERDLVRSFGETYQEYQRTTSMIMPVPKREG